MTHYRSLHLFEHINKQAVFTLNAVPHAKSQGGTKDHFKAFCMKLTNRQIGCDSVHDAASTCGENMVSNVTHVSFFLSSKWFWLLTATSHPVSFLIILSIFLSVFAEQVSFTL